MGTGEDKGLRKEPGRAAGSEAMAKAEHRGRAVAITGANTFLGRNLVRLLAADESVSRLVVLDIANPNIAAPKTRFYEVDLTAPGVDSRVAEILHAEGIDTFVHLAFLESPTQATAFSHELESVGTMHVLHACHKQPVRKLVVSSSVLVYGPYPDNPNFLDEDRPRRGLPGAHYVADKIEVEEQVEAFRQSHPECTVTVLRLGTLLGPTVDNFATRWLSRTLVPTVLGYDPLVQFLHEIDAVMALETAVERDAPGVFNIVSKGVLPVSTVVKLAGRLAIPMPYGLLRRASALLWVAQLSEAPPTFNALLRHLCVADGSRAAAMLGFEPTYSTRDAVLDFEAALRVREARLLAPAT